MKNHAFILSILEAGTVPHATLEEYVAELMFRLEQQLVVRIDQRKARKQLREKMKGQASHIDALNKMLASEKLTGDSVTRLKFLEQHVIDLNVRINAAAKEAYLEGFARRRKRKDDVRGGF